ncbi:uncharacterized protein, partial [Parasteatoda tepidariorum]|uniref:uncharacterized protein n=1 Tax=Parasteatoda tepidariorum TaxID=114398 RepID=UPI0039BCD6E3
PYSFNLISFLLYYSMYIISVNILYANIPNTLIFWLCRAINVTTFLNTQTIPANFKIFVLTIIYFAGLHSYEVKKKINTQQKVLVNTMKSKVMRKTNMKANN